MSTFDSAREAALRLALEHHHNAEIDPEGVVKTASVFLEFLSAETPADKAFKAALGAMAPNGLDAHRPQD